MYTRFSSKLSGNPRDIDAETRIRIRIETVQFPYDQPAHVTFAPLLESSKDAIWQVPLR
jgi:hypothetical protein